MLEQAREIVRKFNSVYGDTLVEPDILLPDNKACLRLPGTDGKAKMSKSLGNCIYLSDTEADVKKKVMSMFTDPNHLRVEDPGNVDKPCIYLSGCVLQTGAFCRVFTGLPESGRIESTLSAGRSGRRQSEEVLKQRYAV